MSDHVLVTGASGFLGFHIVNAAIEKGLVVYAAVRRNSNIKHLEDLPVRYLYIDYESIDETARQLAEHDIRHIIHAAGITKAIKQETYDYINATYTLNLAKAAEQINDRFGKFVFISSLAAVGPLSEQENKITETTPPKPVTAYGRSKLLAEKNLSGVAISSTILRPTAIYGPRDKDIFIMVKTVSKGFDPYIGNFVQQLSFVHAKDVADLAVQSVLTPGASGIYNVTDGNSYNRYQFSDIIKTILKKNAYRFHIPMPIVRTLAFVLETTNGWLKKPSVLSREKLHELAAKNWICDINKAKQELNYSPKFDLQSGLEDSINWYTKNKWI